MSSRRYNWHGPQPAADEEQIANAIDGSYPLVPVSLAPAIATTANWAAVLPSSVPFVWEAPHDGAEELAD